MKREETEGGRKVCTTDNPMPPDADGRWFHSNAVCVGENFEGDADYYECTACGVKWKQQY